MVKSDDAKFLKRERLKRNEFKEVFSRGKRFSNEILTVYVFNGAERKAGFVVRKTVRSGVKRNRLKRLLKEIFRQNKSKLSSKVLIVIMAGKRAEGLPFSDIERSFLKLLNRAGVLM